MSIRLNRSAQETRGKRTHTRHRYNLLLGCEFLSIGLNRWRSLKGNTSDYLWMNSFTIRV
jgi:hypothetical protein